MNLWVVVAVVVAAAASGVIVLVRALRRRYLMANRVRVIKESLERARAKQSQAADATPPARRSWGGTSNVETFGAGPGEPPGRSADGR